MSTVAQQLHGSSARGASFTPAIHVGTSEVEVPIDANATTDAEHIEVIYPIASLPVVS